MFVVRSQRGYFSGKGHDGCVEEAVLKRLYDLECLLS